MASKKVIIIFVFFLVSVFAKGQNKKNKNKAESADECDFGPEEGNFTSGPGFGPRNGPGGAHFPFANLTDEQKTEFENINREIFSPNSTVTKDEAKAKLEAFKNSLPSDVQEALNNRPTPPTPLSTPSTSSLSAEAQALIASIEAVRNDGSITFAQEKDSIKALIEGASESVRNELPGGFGGPGRQSGGFGGPGRQSGGFGGPGGQSGGFGGPGRQSGGFGGPGGQSGGFGGPGGSRGGPGGRVRGCRPKSTTPASA